MKKLEGNKLVALLLSAGMAATLLAACTINTDELGQGISDLGSAFTSQTERQTERTKETTETEETSAPTETTAETVVETSATPTPTPTSTPSPTPLPQRVDFSEYTEIDLTDVFKVTTEEFGEKTYSDDNTTLLATFEGTRLVVTEASNKNIRDSINLIVDGFYAEAEGAYSRVASKAKAEFKQNGVIEVPSAVTVDFQYTTNGRALSVLMVYEVKGVAAEEKTVVDFASFDMLSGQYITFATISVDPEGLEDALRRGLVNSLRVQPTPAPSTAPVNTRETDEEEEENEPETTARIPSATDLDRIYIAPGPATAEGANNSFATIYGVADDVVYSAVIDINAYSDFLNRYGTSVLIGA
ncbi:MAG: hypothetical protein IKG03_04330 [Clostridiales bacterium]|jgi:hypothetical protein|nr:hypothetical protein [Clostridiales bacterium]